MKGIQLPSSYAKALGENFYKVVPLFRTLEPFSKLYDRDKELASKMLWLLAYFYDRESPVSNLPEKERRQKLSQALFGDKSYYAQHRHEFFAYDEAWKKLILSPMERMLMTQEKAIQERSILLDRLYSSNVDGQTAEEAIKDGDALMLKTPKIVEAYKQAEKLYRDEVSERNYGGSKNSLLESGGLLRGLDEDE